jgi:hypothetical protein
MGQQPQRGARGSIYAYETSSGTLPLHEETFVRRAAADTEAAIRSAAAGSGW